MIGVMLLICCMTLTILTLNISYGVLGLIWFIIFITVDIKGEQK